MEPENLKFGGGLAHTVFNPYVAILVIIAGGLICFAPRRGAIAAFLAACLLIPTDQVLVVGIFHFPVLRILIIFGLARILWAKAFSKTEICSGGTNGIDISLIFLTFFTLLDGALLWQQWGELIYQIGMLYTAFGLYFLLRFLIRDKEDLKQALRTLAYISALLAMIMVYERVTGRNPLYALLGGARSTVYGSALERNGEFRATASFAHPILAGTFGAIVLPLFFGLWQTGKENRKLALLGMTAAVIMPIAANSSTSLFGLIGGVVALCCWPVRKLMRPIRWGIALTIISLHIVMKAPVWHLISRIDLSGGSSSYHRFQLVNQCILHFGDWFWVGTKDYPTWGWDMWDLSNQYVAVGETAGIIPFVFFLAIIVLGFRYLGMARKEQEGNKKQELFIWAIGSALFANVVAFFGISYFDQTIVAWYALLAMISVATLTARSAVRKPAENFAGAKLQTSFRSSVAFGQPKSRLSGALGNKSNEPKRLTNVHHAPFARKT